MGLLDGRRLLLTGVLTESSLASGVTRLALSEGADVVLTAPPATARLVGRVATRLGVEQPVLPLDVTDAADLAGLGERLDGIGWSHVDGVLHAIGFAPESALGDAVAAVPWSDVSVALHVSAWSLAGLVHALRPRLARGSSVVGLDFDSSRAWPGYGWMGVAKAALASSARYLARELGPDCVRVNLVSAGPVRTMAARHVPGFDELAGSWTERAPLGWDLDDSAPVARAVVALLSDWFPATTGEVVHVDGGAHAVG